MALQQEIFFLLEDTKETIKNKSSLEKINKIQKSVPLSYNHKNYVYLNY